MSGRPGPAHHRQVRPFCGHAAPAPHACASHLPPTGCGSALARGNAPAGRLPEMKAANAFAALLDADAPAKPAGKRGKGAAAAAAAPPAPAAAAKAAPAPSEQGNHSGWTDSAHRRKSSGGGGSSNGGAAGGALAASDAGRTGGGGGDTERRDGFQAEAGITAASVEAEAAAAVSADARLHLLQSWAHAVRAARHRAPAASHAARP